MKNCSKCLILKPFSDFYKWTRGKDGSRSACKSCTDSKHKEYATKHKEKINRYKNFWAKENPEKAKKSAITYRKKYIEKARARCAKRRSNKLQATPRWLTKEQFKEIEKFYKECPKSYHVDHIIPLKGKEVRGLHVPWNLQILSASENSKKSNKVLI